MVCWNLERNGKGDPDIRRAADEILRRLEPDIVLRQEMLGADARGHTVFNEQCQALGMRGVLGPGACTAIFYNPEQFELVRDWSTDRTPGFVLPPTIITVRLTEAGPDAVPFNLASYHLAYGSAQQRLLEAEWMTTWADRGWTAPDGCQIVLPFAGGGDSGTVRGPRRPSRSGSVVGERRLHRPVRTPRSTVLGGLQAHVVASLIRVHGVRCFSKCCAAWPCGSTASSGRPGGADRAGNADRRPGVVVEGFEIDHLVTRDLAEGSTPTRSAKSCGSLRIATRDQLGLPPVHLSTRAMALLYRVFAGDRQVRLLHAPQHRLIYANSVSSNAARGTYAARGHSWRGPRPFPSPAPG
ncbi:hypothetical protein SMICM17S_06201 [Streptomyces microflavus]